MNKPPLRLVIRKTGAVEYVHDDALVRVCAALSPPKITRASHIEPDCSGQWWVDLSPCGGPKLGPYPSDQYQQARRDEDDWIYQHRLAPGTSQP